MSRNQFNCYLKPPYAAYIRQQAFDEKKPVGEVVEYMVDTLTDVGKLTAHLSREFRDRDPGPMARVQLARLKALVTALLAEPPASIP